MDRVSQNDRAFLTVYKEIAKLSTAHNMLKNFDENISRIHMSYLDHVGVIDDPKVRELVENLKLYVDGRSLIRGEIGKIDDRLKALKRLKQAYDDGQDIIASKLAQD